MKRRLLARVGMRPKTKARETPEQRRRRNKEVGRLLDRIGRIAWPITA